MCTYIMYLSVMSSFLWPYCFRTQTFHSDCHRWYSSAETGVRSPRPSLLCQLQFYIFPFPFFCIAYFSFHFTYTTCLQIKFHSLPCSPFKELIYPEQCTVCVTVHSVTSEKCLWNLSKCLQQQYCFQMTINFRATSFYLCFQEPGLFSLKTSSEN